MLRMSDTNLTEFLPVFAQSGVQVAFLVPTPTGFEKSIMDATYSVRDLFRETRIHDYELQQQGPEYKKIIKTFLVNRNSITETETSLYRPRTKMGDPRMWIYNLKRYCRPYNLLALIVSDETLYVFNLSNPEISESLLWGGYCYDILREATMRDEVVAQELLEKLREIHNRGFLPTVTYGDPGVGDTLENALGIRRNNIAAPDYRGIELKTTRLTRGGRERAITRSTLFTKVPDEGLTYRQIVDIYGKEQIPRGQTVARLQLYETLRCSRANAYDLILNVDAGNNKLVIEHITPQSRDYVSAWYFSELRNTLLNKHRETFWIKAQSQMINGVEHFRYDKVVHTKSPNVSLLEPLFETDKITIDLAGHYKPDGNFRNHGILFKMNPNDLHLLLGSVTEYDL